MRPPAWMIACVALVVLLAGQALGDAAVPSQYADTGANIGRAGFAYLTGLRVFVAAVVWNRLEPVYHEYYLQTSLADQAFMMPTIRLVNALDPQFREAYYVASWILADRGDPDQGFDVARRGVENNPDSGLLRVNYAQLLLVFKGDLREAVRQADEAIDRDSWETLADKHDGYGVLSVVYKNAIRQGIDVKNAEDRGEFIAAELEKIDAELGDTMPAGTHDHDGDGVPDH